MYSFSHITLTYANIRKIPEKGYSHIGDQSQEVFFGSQNQFTMVRHIIRQYVDLLDWISQNQVIVQYVILAPCIYAIILTCFLPTQNTPLNHSLSIRMLVIELVSCKQKIAHISGFLYLALSNGKLHREANAKK